MPLCVGVVSGWENGGSGREGKFSPQFPPGTVGLIFEEMRRLVLFCVALGH